MSVARIVAAGAVALGGCLYIDLGDDHHEAGWSACDLTSECTLASDGCCDVCSVPTLADVDAVNAARLDAHFAEVCPVPVPCPRCATRPNPELVATCDGGTCRALDVGALAITACTADSDCRLRTTACCECGGDTDPWALIAVATTGEGAYAALVCDPGVACQECLPQYPDTVEAFCDLDHHCAVRDAPIASPVAP